MNRTTVKNFANWARGYLKQQIAARAAQFGVTRKTIIEPQFVSGGLLVAGQILNTAEANQYQQLKLRLDELSQQQENAKTPGEKLAKAVELLIDEIAYTWFNRLAALRFMEVNNYIGRVLSSSDPNLVDPDILRDAYSIAEMEELPGLNLETLTQWRKFASREPNPDGYIYRRMLLAQCEALSASIPTLFDKKKNYQGLFLPINLLNQDSIIRRFVKDIAEEDWQDIEIVGWLYQFYISDRKDEIIGAKSKIEAQDIPAATQLFTPRWIVQYMVENSLGRLWLESHPESKLREKMPYFLEGGKLGDVGRESSVINSVETVGETKEPLLELLDQAEKTSLPLHSRNTSPSLPQTPQELTVIDPACGSGHILVYAFDLLLEIYKEQGYLERDIPALILTHNLYGLDIDERAVQLASFAVVMKARAVNSRILRKPPALNIMTVGSTRSQVLPPVPELNPEDWEPLLDAFEDADSLGSLITPPDFDGDKLRKQLDDLQGSNPIFKESVIPLYNLISQAELLTKQYWVVVANPPYMGNKSLNEVLKKFASKNYPDSKSDTFSMFVERFLSMILENGFIGVMTPFTWMFLSSYEKLRKTILNNTTITSLVRPEYHAFFDSAYVPICTFTLLNRALPQYQGTFIDLNQFYGTDLQPVKVLEAIKNPDCGYLYYAKSADFAKIPGYPIIYNLLDQFRNSFQNNKLLSDFGGFKRGTSTSNNERFLRYWHEVKLLVKTEPPSNKWFPYNKGGEKRRWYGNLDYLINWENNGEEIANHKKSYLRNVEYNFLPSISYTSLTSGEPSFRFYRNNAHDQAGNFFPLNDIETLECLLSCLNSKPILQIISLLNPTLNILIEELNKIPVILTGSKLDISQHCISISKQDWDNFETSWDFQTHPLLRHKTKHLSEAFDIWQNQAETAFRELQHLEEENNRYWIEAYGLQEELTPEVPDDQITIRRADLNRDIRSLISYAVGCMMGRYSLDHPGLIHAGQPFDPGLHQTFTPSSNPIIPITDQAYFDKDIVTQFMEFMRVAYSPDTLMENLNFIANALTQRNDETPIDRIRRYFLQEFISDHIRTYKKRPIYWLFTSGKKQAFGALVYLHRYNQDTLARLRMDYVLELQVKLDGEMSRAQQQLDSAIATTTKKAASKRLKELQEQQLELREYQAKLQHLADTRIKIDLDDGVAYNYTLFKGLVYEGTDLKMADLEKASKWKRELLKQDS
ncbi:BREX-1 system adenine-specific DNA-methyltransferase PglX [Anabaenopsis elenkinii]|uniref:site-specific DNA-methyltransferase (adenine-specific) n=1 Tax=Anabaenopsis elenkinii CCIBt3563 TaxID=2779889 RepID=A0A7U3RZI0_9CYAN|nr:BREX-1 system adenine-specific DNA-methyltransferase PglX [Anabaenopsis elenkinii]QOV21431.1 BREX-1 system adenine-specific DNA-methyltransferase PglX [Anabaenopsis elenkinii CCIBt3563]